jgi:hypothetical protein
MSLSTIMSHAGLSGYAIAGMVIFLAVFLGLSIRYWLMYTRGEMKGKSAMPLDDGSVAGLDRHDETREQS